MTTRNQVRMIVNELIRVGSQLADFAKSTDIDFYQNFPYTNDALKELLTALIQLTSVEVYEEIEGASEASSKLKREMN